MADWKPSLGQVALIELSTGADDCFTGVVLSDGDGDGAVVIDLGASPPLAEVPCEVTASFFDPDALYRVRATLSPREGRSSVVELLVRDVERVQRRVAARACVSVPVALSNLDGGPGGGVEFSSVHGESIDIGEGSCRVVVDGRFPPGYDPTVALDLSSEDTVVALAAVLEEQERPDRRFEYRLVFIDQDDGHRDHLAKFLANA